MTECPLHAPHAWIVRCSHFALASVTQRDYRHPDYLMAYEIEEREPRFGVWGIDEETFELIVDVETDSREEADAAFADAVARMVGQAVAL